MEVKEAEKQAVEAFKAIFMYQEPLKKDQDLIMDKERILALVLADQRH